MRDLTNLRSRRSTLAMSCAALLLLVQSIAGAHFHQRAAAGYLHDRPAVDLLCAVCLFDLHCPSKPAAPVIIPRPTPIAVSGLIIHQTWRLTTPIASAVSRGPPRAVRLLSA